MLLPVPTTQKERPLSYMTLPLGASKKRHKSEERLDM
jgi:hypothetical protein